MSNALALCFFCFRLRFSVECVVHQQGHLVIRFELGSPLLIELDIHLQCFGVQHIHGFFSLDAFLLGLPFGKWAANLIAHLIAS